MKIKNRILCALTFLFLAGMGGWLLIKSPDVYSNSERRTLARKYEISAEQVMNGKFMTEFEAYSLDQFPLRDSFRSVKAVTEHYLFHKKDSNGIYLADGYLSKIEYPLAEEKVAYSCEKMQEIYDRYLAEAGIQPYLVVIPDKNYFLADANGMVSMDYDTLYESVYEQCDEMKPVEIRDLLELSDYYRTDTHWKQECIQKVAEQITTAMGNDGKAEYEAVRTEAPFYGVYVGQSALPVEPDSITYLTNDTLKECVVTCYDGATPVQTEVYNQEKLSGKDPYELFLSGAVAVVTIENPNASTGKELVIFRDSFGSSLAPLLIENYQKITLIDLRYINSDMVGEFVDFGREDVLFLYSTLLLNSGLGR